MRRKVVWVCAIFIVCVHARANIDFLWERNSSLDDFEGENVESQVRKNHRRVVTFESDNIEGYGDRKIRQEEATKAEESHRIVLEFGKRVLESVSRYEILKDKASLIKSGQYRIDWWKKDRRLQRIRKRLFEELARQPKLENHLRSLGWLGTRPEKVFHEKAIRHDRTSVKAGDFESQNGCKDSLVYKILTTSFENLPNLDFTSLNKQGTPNGELAAFVYMKIVLARPGKTDREVRTPATGRDDSPTKFSLDTHEHQVSAPLDVGIIDIESRETPISNHNEFQRGAPNSSGESIDTDRLLQLMPLIVDELRNGRINNEERHALSWIFGKRLWHLLEREASKKADETMDKDLATFLIKGELADPGMTKRKRRQPSRSSFVKYGKLKNFEASIDREGDSVNQRITDYDFQRSDKYYEDEETPEDWASNQVEQSDETRLVESLDLGITKMNWNKRQEENKERRNPIKWLYTHDEYARKDYDY